MHPPHFQHFQGVILCGPEMEDCVKNQAFKDQTCLVPCDGLYADIADDIESLKKKTQTLELNVIKGNILFGPRAYPLSKGFETLTEEVSYMAANQEESKQRIMAALQQMFPALVATVNDMDEVARLTESYYKYKREYVKHLSFNLDNQDPGK